MKRVVSAFLFLMAANAYADPVRVDVSQRDCQKLMLNSADYVAGVSVTGKPVTPADLKAQAGIPSPDLENASFPVYLDLERDYPFWNSELETGVLPVARVDFRDNGIFVNGTPVSEKTADALKNECLKRNKP